MLISEKENTRISKFLSLVLRHQPQTLGLQLDENGWTNVEQLLDGMNQAGFSIDRQILIHVVETNAKKRFAFNETQDRIRANQGHSIEVELGYHPQNPPAILYHGTSIHSVTAIQQLGLTKMSRHHVHLSADVETATKVGQRKGKSVVFEVYAKQMFDQGFIFYQSDNGVWLTDRVPANFLKLLFA